MPKAKKKWKKAAPDAVENFTKVMKLGEQDIQKKPDHELFTTEIDTQEVNKARLTLREKLEMKKKKEKARLSSKTEKLLVKRKMASLSNLEAGKEQRKKKKENDVWDEEETGLARKKKKYKEYARTKESVVPVILKPHPGQSYNPEAGDHEELLKKVAQQAVKEIEKQEELKRKARPSQEDKLMKEEIEGIIDGCELIVDEDADLDSGDNQSDEEEDLQMEEKSERKRNIGKETRWKSQKKRIQKTKNKLLQAAEKKKRIQEKILKQASSIPSFLGQLEKQKKEEEKKEAERVKRKQEEDRLEREGKLIRAKRLGRHQYKPSKPLFQLTEEIPDSLRKVKQTTSVLHDRVDSLMSRGKIEVPWDAETLKRSETKKGKLRKKLRSKTYERSTGIQRFFEEKKVKEDKKKGIFY